MKPVHFRIKMLTLLTIFGLGPVHGAPQPDLLDHDARRLSSDETVNLKEIYGGKVVLIVNTASKCAFTGQYEGLEALYAKYRDRGLVVLGFPSNDFGGQDKCIAFSDICPGKHNNDQKICPGSLDCCRLYET